MLKCRSIALDNLTKTIPMIDEDQKMDLLHASFTLTTLFGVELLAKLQKANTELASALTVFPTPAASSTSYTPQTYVGQGRSEEDKHIEEYGAGDKIEMLLPLLLNRPNDGQTTMSVTVPQETTKSKMESLLALSTNIKGNSKVRD